MSHLSEYAYVEARSPPTPSNINQKHVVGT